LAPSALAVRGIAMPTYIRLATLTEQAVRNLNRLGDMIADARKVFEANGCRLIQSWSTLGPYDLVAVVDGPDDATLMKVSALIAKQGNFRGVTLPAVTMADFVASVK
jgi:uncharacterized protein with GYD domain